MIDKNIVTSSENQVYQDLKRTMTVSQLTTSQNSVSIVLVSNSHSQITNNESHIV